MPDTIRGRITVFFIGCLLFVGLLTALYYENTVTLRRKIVIMQAFDDLVNDTLELRRYEKNFIYYKDIDSLNESVFYLFKIEDVCKQHGKDITRVVGKEKCRRFRQVLGDYKTLLEKNMKSAKTGGGPVELAAIRLKGGAMVNFTQSLVKLKRHRINRALDRSLIIPLTGIASFVLLIVVFFRLVNRSILQPLSLLEKATEEVTKNSFTPISYQVHKKDEISRLIGAFNKMAQELKSEQEQLLQSRKLASIGTLTSGIAHELNNPLNNISLTAETLQLSYPNITEEELIEYIQDILLQTERASQVVKNLLEFSRSEKPDFEPVQLSDVIDKTIKLLQNQTLIAGIELDKEIPKGLPLIQGQPRNLEQALLNILLNGMQAMPEGGKLTVRVKEVPEGFLRVDLSDSGCGIDRSHLPHIFDPFFTTKEVGKGTGLGLSITYGIVKKHGGRIDVTSEAGQGTTFSIFLPIAK